MCNWSKGVREEGRKEGKVTNMLKVFLRLLSMGMRFDEAVEISGAETEEEIKYLREHMPA